MLISTTTQTGNESSDDVRLFVGRAVTEEGKLQVNCCGLANHHCLYLCNVEPKSTCIVTAVDQLNTILFVFVMFSQKAMGLYFP